MWNHGRLKLPAPILVSPSCTRSPGQCPVPSWLWCTEVQPKPVTWDTQRHSYYDRPASQTSVKVGTVGTKGVEEVEVDEENDEKEEGRQ